MTDDPFSSPEAADAAGTSPHWLWTWLFASLLGVAIAGGGIALLLMPLMNRARYSMSRSRLHTIGFALHNYHDDFGSFPPAYTIDGTGRPLHSWRTLLLPYLEQQSLYETIDLSKPWDDPANAQPFEATVPVYQYLASGNHTNYMGVSGPNSVFSGTDSVRFNEITEGTANTILVVEVPMNRTVPWMKPVDVDDVAAWGTDPESDVPYGDSFHVLFASGQVSRIRLSIDQATLKALITISAGDDVGEF